MDSTYDVLFFKITQLLLTEDKQLAHALESMEHLDFSQIGLPSSIQDARKRVRSAILIFERIGSFRTPLEKLDCLVNTIASFTETHHLDSDALIPLLLITLVKSKVPHLTANLIYMKDYTFEQNTVTGKYAYALSTFEGVLNYILTSSPDLSHLSAQNRTFWSAIQRGDLDHVKKELNSELCDTEGNNALMVACIYGQPHIVQYLLSHSTLVDAVNDHGHTPLMCAVMKGSLETAQLLLQDEKVQESIHRVDDSGNTALLYAAASNNVSLMDTLLTETDGVPMKNTMTHDTILHVAVRSNCSTLFLKRMLPYYSTLKLSRNHKGETLYHVCESAVLLRCLLDHEDRCMQARDNEGRTPFMTWAMKGRLDLIELIWPYIGAEDVVKVDHQGQNVLHLIAQRRHLTFGQNSMYFIVEKFREAVHARDWVYGNTPLHYAAESIPNQNTIVLIKALVCYGACLDAINFRDEYPIDICKAPELIACLDGI